MIDRDAKEHSINAKDGSTNRISKTPDIINLEIQDIENIDPTSAKKMKEAATISAKDSAETSGEELAVDINSSKENASTTLHPDLYQLEE